MIRGLYGGSFDPLHLGHLGALKWARERFCLDRVELLPSPQPPHKPGLRLVPAALRYAMVVAATLDEDKLFASAEELDHEGPSYTVETLQRHREAAPDDRFVFILGSDSLAEITTWHRWAELIELADLLILRRAGSWGESLRAEVPLSLWAQRRMISADDRITSLEASPRVWLADNPPIEISATELRRMLATTPATREAAAELLPGPVYAVIEKYGLYGQRRKSAGR